MANEKDTTKKRPRQPSDPSKEMQDRASPQRQKLEISEHDKAMNKIILNDSVVSMFPKNQDLDMNKATNILTLIASLNNVDIDPDLEKRSVALKRLKHDQELFSMLQDAWRSKEFSAILHLCEHLISFMPTPRSE